MDSKTYVQKGWTDRKTSGWTDRWKDNSAIAPVDPMLANKLFLNVKYAAFEFLWICRNCND